MYEKCGHSRTFNGFILKKLNENKDMKEKKILGAV
jgi:hypothetical protein